jgi:WD40 repeat protein
MIQTFLTAVAITALAAGPGEAAEGETGRVLEQRFESFDRDPGWDSHNNRVIVDDPIAVVQDFGYSRTKHAGGEAAGEIGGRIQRSNKPAFYGMRLTRPRSFDVPLHCSGSFAVTQSMGMSSLYFGWFNTKTMEVRPRNWLGMYINGEDEGCEVRVGYNTATGRSEGLCATGVGPGGRAARDFNRIPYDGTRYTFDFRYDPDANGGHGRFTFTLGGDGPYTGGPFTFDLPPEHRKAGATFDAFGIINQQSAGNYLTIWFDDLVIDGEKESFDRDPAWLGQGNRAEHDDFGLEGAHQFGFSKTSFAGGESGEVGGRLYSSDRVPGYYGDVVGRLTLDDPLTASGRVRHKLYGHDGGMYLGWFNSRRRGWPPENVLGVLIDGSTSSGPRLRGCIASADPKIAHCQWETAPPVSTDGATHSWKINYAPQADEGAGRLSVWIDDREDSFTVPGAVRRRGAEFDRFGLFVLEQGGRLSEVYFDDISYTALAGDVDQSVRTFTGHTGSVMGIEFSADGKTLVSCSRDGAIRFWDPSSGELLRTLEEHTGDVYDIAFSPRGDLLASSGRDKIVRLWDIESGEVLRRLQGHTDIVRSVAFSPDQKLLASGSVDQSVKLWDVAAGRLLRTMSGHTARVKSVVFSPDGKWIATAASDRTIRIWDVASGRELARLQGHKSDIETLALSPDGKLLASSSNDTTVRLWNVAARKTVRILQGHTAEVDSVDFSPNGRLLASGGKDTFIKLWDVDSGELLQTLSGHTGRVESLAFSPDGRTIATGGGGGDSAVKLWKLNAGDNHH